MLKIKTNHLTNSGKYTLQLIYVFYIMSDINTFDQNPMYELHFRCLTYFKTLFNNCLFIISADDLNNPLINEAKYKLNDIFYDTNIQFIIEQNHPENREGEYFDKYIIQKLYNYKEYEHNENELTFFGHTKGVCNYSNNNNTSMWTASMYYFNLLNINEAANHILYNDKLCFGFPCIDTLLSKDDIKIIYIGSFSIFCLNKLKKYIDDNHIDIYHKLLYNNVLGYIRWSTERFLPLIIDKKDAFDYPMNNILKPLYIDLYNSHNVYNENEFLNKVILNYIPYQSATDFLKFYNNITEGLNFNKIKN